MNLQTKFVSLFLIVLFPPVVSPQLSLFPSLSEKC